MEEDEFKLWLVSSNSDDKTRCRLCKKDIELSNMGIQVLLSHCNGKKYKANDIKVKLFFQPKRAKPNPGKAAETDTACDTSESSKSFFTHSKPCSSKMQASLESVVTNSEQTKAEILQNFRSITAGYSNRSCSDKCAISNYVSG